MASSLSSVVSNLVRASMGSSVSGTVTDEDLDRHVAELILKEAKKKAEQYGQRGIRAYISSNLSDSNAPKTNKRFLTSIIKSTDEHNKTVLRAQAQAAQEVKREREEQERRQRRLRAEEAAEAERLRRSGKRKRVDKHEGWDRWDGRNSERKKVSRNWESWDGYEDDEIPETSSRRRSASGSRSRSRDRDRHQRISRSNRPSEDDHDEESTRRRRHGRSRSRSHSPRRTLSHGRHDDDKSRRTRHHNRDHSPRRSRRSRSRSPLQRQRSPSSSNTDDRRSKRKKRSHSPRYALDDLRDESSSHRPQKSASPLNSDVKAGDREAELKQHLKYSRRKAKDPSSPLPKSHVASVRSRIRGKSPESGPSSRRSPSPMTISRSPSPGPQLPLQLPSKMDRYFEESYDPRLDVAPLSAPQVPATGLINDADFESWDAMLELIRIRREDKEEKKRMERLGLLPKEKSKSKKKSVIESSTAAVADRWGVDGISVMDIEYKKRGAVREWDMGKEGF